MSSETLNTNISSENELENFFNSSTVNIQEETKSIEPQSDIQLTEELPSQTCLLYTSPSPRDVEESRMPSSA